MEKDIGKGILDTLQMNMHSNTEPKLKLKENVSAARLQVGLLNFVILNIYWNKDVFICSSNLQKCVQTQIYQTIVLFVCIYIYVNIVIQTKTSITKNSLHAKVSSMVHISLGRGGRGQEKRKEEWGEGSPPPAKK